MTHDDRRAVLSFDEALERFDPVMGLEVHVELNTALEDVLRLPDRVRRRAQHPGLPGLPRACPARCRWSTRTAVESAIRIGLALNCAIAEWCRFARKNYFYPDMPKNFQTSQYDEPIAFDGWTDVDVDGETVRVEIERAHMEEDTGKSLHVGGATGRIHGADYSLVDYNRAGIPLIEIVTKPIDGHRRARRPRSPGRTSRSCATCCSASASPTSGWSRARCAATSTCRCAPAGSGAARHPHRDQERQLAALGRAGRALRDRPAGRGARRRAARSCRRPGTGTRTPASPRRAARSPTPRTTATSPSPTWCRSRRRASGSRSCGPRCPSRRASGAPGCRQDWGFTDLEMRDIVGAGALGLVEETVAAGASPAAARKWWLSELARRANEQGVDLADAAGDARPRSPGSRRWSTRARSTTSWPARCSTACSPARARPTRSSPPAGSRWSPTRARCRRPSTARSRPTPTWPTRSATARSPPPVR